MKNKFQVIGYIKDGTFLPLEWISGEEHAWYIKYREEPFDYNAITELFKRGRGLFLLEYEFERYIQDYEYLTAPATDPPMYVGQGSTTPLDNKQLLSLRGKRED